MSLDSRIPAGPIADKWEKHKFEMKLVKICLFELIVRSTLIIECLGFLPFQFNFCW